MKLYWLTCCFLFSSYASDSSNQAIRPIDLTEATTRRTPASTTSETSSEGTEQTKKPLTANDYFKSLYGQTVWPHYQHTETKPHESKSHD